MLQPESRVGFQPNSGLTQKRYGRAVKFSANLGFLWTNLPLPAAIAAARGAGFDAVEFHAPYHLPSAELARAVADASIDAVSINTRFGDQDGDFGIAAIGGRESQARDFIDEAIAYAAVVGCPAVHVTAGRTERSDEAEATYCANLSYAANQAARHDMTILIEPLSDPHYHLRSVDQGLQTIATVAAPNLKLLFDCFHAWHNEPDLLAAIGEAGAHIGHVQFASLPDRHEPDQGVVDYGHVLPTFAAMGYTGAFGAEYHPAGDIDDGIHWLADLRKRLPDADRASPQSPSQSASGDTP